jgi:AAA+ ATPase superfamily predicted ATPase
MSFVKLLQGIGDRLGILEAVSGSEPHPLKRIQTRSISLKELAGEIKSGEIRALADSLAELSAPFDTIYETAGISSNPQDWTIERLKQIVAREGLSGKSREDVQRTVLELLKAEGVPAEKLVQDAMARDKALDSYEEFVGEKMKARMNTWNRKQIELELKIKELQDECKTLKSALESDESKWREWRKQKRMRERELATLVSYVVDHSVITLDDADEA